MIDCKNLKASPLFFHFDRKEIKELALHMEELRLTTNSKLFDEGEKGSALYYIHKGRVKLLKKASPEVEVVVAELGPGDLFGEMALLTNAPRSTACVVSEQAVFYTLKKGRFEDLEWTAFHLYSQLVENLTSVICSRLGTVTARVAQVIEELDEASSRRSDLEKQVSLSRDGLVSIWAPQSTVAPDKKP